MADPVDLAAVVARVEAHVSGACFGLTFPDDANVSIIAYDPEDERLSAWTSGQLKVADLRLLLAALAAAREDGERLDWMHRHYARFQSHSYWLGAPTATVRIEATWSFGEDYAGHEVRAFEVPYSQDTSVSFRAAIDAARSEAPDA